jgi:alginate O-acetyltransferase complex protein AlgI
MVFSSAQFIFLFLPVALALYFISPVRLRNGALLGLSILFYSAGEHMYLWLLLLIIGLNYITGRVLDALSGRTIRRVSVGGAIAIDLTALGFFKYASFFGSWLSVIHQHAIWQGIILPLGISFYIFHNISYVVDVYRGVAKARRNLIDFALYVSFFPQVIAGPIIRYHDISSYLDDRYPTLSDFSSGLERFLIGLAKKMVIANPLGAIADRAFIISPETLTCWDAWIGIICYTLQIYFDFSGYSDMAIGLARMFGFQFLENFNYPYVSRSLREFWQRWHISLSNWFMEYLYIPLGGSRRGTARTAMNLIIVFLLCGFWHGAAWTFIAWGAMHGVLLGIERTGFGKVLGRSPVSLAKLYTLLAVTLTWVMFRADTISQAFLYYGALFNPFRTSTYPQLPVSNVTWLLVVVSVVGASGAFTWLARDWPGRSQQVRGKVAPVGISDSTLVIMMRLSLLCGLSILSFMQLAADVYNPFIYFRF